MWIVDILKSNRYYERKLNEKKNTIQKLITIQTIISSFGWYEINF